MATTATGRRTCSSKRPGAASKSSPLFLAILLTAPLARPAEPVFRSEPLSASLLEKVRQTTFHPGCPVAPADLRELTLAFRGYDHATHTGTLIVHRDLAPDVIRLFRELYRR